jgi:hypothetical protein
MRTVAEIMYVKDDASGNLLKIIDGPIYVCDKEVVRLCSSKAHCNLYDATMTVTSENMTINYPTGHKVTMLTDPSGLFLFPLQQVPADETKVTTLLPHRLQNPTTQTPDTSTALATIRLLNDHCDLSPTTVLLQSEVSHRDILACLSLFSGTPPVPSQTFEEMYQTTLQGLGIPKDLIAQELEDLTSGRAQELKHLQDLGIKYKPSMAYLELLQRLGYRSPQYIMQAAKLMNITLRSKDEALNKDWTSKQGNATRKELISQPPPICEAGRHYTIYLDAVPGFPQSHEKHYTSFILCVGNPGVARGYFSSTKTMKAADHVNAVKQFCIDSQMITPTAQYGPRMLRTDNASVYATDEFQQCLRDLKATHVRAPSYSQEVNHTCEAKVRLIVSMALSMIHGADMPGLSIDPMTLWPYAITHACLIDSLLPGPRGEPSSSEIETGVPGNLKQIVTFGSPCGVAQTKEGGRQKTDPHIRLAYCLGRAPNAHEDAYNCIMLDTLKVVCTRNVYFDKHPKFTLLPTVFDTLLPGTECFDPTTDSMVMAYYPTQDHTSSTTPTPDTTTSIPPPPPPTTLPEHPQPQTTFTSTKKQRNPIGKEMFKLDQQCRVKYGETYYDGIVDKITNQTVTVYFPKDESFDVINRNDFHTVLPPMQPTTTNKSLNAVLTVVKDMSKPVTTMISELIAAASTTMRAKTPSLPKLCKSPFVILAAALCAAVSVDPEILHQATVAQEYATVVDDFGVTIQNITPSVYALKAGNMTAKSIVKHPRFDELTTAGQGEYNDLEDRGVWQPTLITDLPPDADLCDGAMNYTVKRSGKCKARYCINGAQATFGLSYHHTNASTPSLNTIRCFAASCCALDEEVVQFDFTKAFCSCKIDVDNLFIRHPEPLRTYMYEDGITRPTSTHNGSTGVELVGHLRYALYGANQSMTVYNKEFKALHIKDGFSCSPSAPNLFTKTFPDGHTIKTVAFVDDLLVAKSKDNPHYEAYKTLLASVFIVTGGEPVDDYLGARFRQDLTERTLTIDQQLFIETTCSEFLGTAPRKLTPTVLPTSFIPTVADAPTTDIDKRRMLPMAKSYRSTLGKLQWAVSFTRPDAAHAVSTLARFSSNPGKVHHDAMKWLCHYLYNTSDYCLRYHSTPTSDGILEGWVDADWATCRDTRRSQSGFNAFLQGAPVAWTSRRQQSCSMSTLESELQSLTAGSMTVVHLRRLVADVGLPQDQPTTMYEDNNPVIQAARNESISHAARHIALRHFKVKELIEDGEIVPHFIRSAHNHADILTKNVSAPTLANHVPYMLGTIR